jgi:hypothetical protein
MIMKISLLKYEFGRLAENKIREAHDRSTDGAIACLETFYYSFNNKDIDTFRNVWFMDSLIQLNDPLGGTLRGITAIEGLYSKIFEGPLKVWVKFSDIICYRSGDMAVFTGTETGEFINGHELIPLKFITTRVFTYANDDERWCQLHHHGSIDDPCLLKNYRNAVNYKALVAV